MAKLLDSDWAFVREAESVLEDYLLSPELYWPLGQALPGSNSLGMLQFTLGNLVLSLERLSAVNWPPEQQADLAARRAHIEAVRTRWHANWSKKAGQEYQSRLKQWVRYFQDLSSEDGPRASGYGFQVRLRTILELLSHDIIVDPVGAPTDALPHLDARLRAITQPGGFVWEAEVQPAFPETQFWYLYVTIKPQR